MEHNNFKDALRQSLEQVAKSFQEFTNDDVFEYFDRNYSEYDLVCNDRRVYGNIVQKAVRDGIIEWTGTTVISRRKNCHSMLIRKWRSKVYETNLPWYKRWYNKLGWKDA